MRPPASATAGAPPRRAHDRLWWRENQTLDGLGHAREIVEFTLGVTVIDRLGGPAHARLQRRRNTAHVKRRSAIQEYHIARGPMLAAEDRPDHAGALLGISAPEVAQSAT